MGGSSDREGPARGQPSSESLDGSLTRKVQNHEKRESSGDANHTNDRDRVMPEPAV